MPATATRLIASWLTRACVPLVPYQDGELSWWDVVRAEFYEGNLGTPTVGDAYVASLYFAVRTPHVLVHLRPAGTQHHLTNCVPSQQFATITTVGYGDIVPVRTTLALAVQTQIHPPPPTPTPPAIPSATRVPRPEDQRRTGFRDCGGHSWGNNVWLRHRQHYCARRHADRQLGKGRSPHEGSVRISQVRLFVPAPT